MSVSRCQRCHEEITIPAGLAPASEVQCPLCQDVFELSEVMSAVPPTLIVVNAVPSAPAESGSEVEGLGLGAGMSASSFSLDGGVSGEDDMGELKLAPETAGFSPAKASASATSSSAPRSTSRKRKGKSPVAEILKVVLGGVFGLGGGYFILLWVFGVNAVPELTNTISRFAAFAVPAKFHDPALKEKQSSSLDGSGDALANADALPPLPEDARALRSPVEPQAAVFANEQNNTEEMASSDTTLPDFDFSSPDAVLDGGTDDEVASEENTGQAAEQAADVDVTDAQHFVAESPQVTLNALSGAIDQAQTALATWDAEGDGDHQQQAVRAMATVGELLPYADHTNEQVKLLLPQVATLMKGFTGPKKRGDWINHTDSRLRQAASETSRSIGFLAIGKVGETAARGDFYVTPVQLAGPAKTEVLVVSQDEASSPPKGKIIALLGEILADPSRIKGYEKPEQPTAILAHFIKLGK